MSAVTQPRLPISARTFVRNLAANWVMLVAEVAVAFLLTPFIVSRLGLAAYGVWGVLNSVIGYLGLVDLGIRGSIGRFVNYHLGRNEPREVNEVIVTSLAFLSAMALLAFLVSFVVAAFFGTLFPKTPAELLDDASLVLPLMALGLWFAFSSAIFRTVVAAFDRFDLINLVGLVFLILRTAATVAVLWAGWGLKGLVLVNVVNNALGTWALLAVARRLFATLQLRRALVSRTRFREIWKFGVVSFGSRTASTLAVQTAPIVAMTFIGPKAVGVYGIAQMLIQNCQRVVEQLGVTIYPTIMKLGGTGERAAMRAAFEWYSRAVLLVGGLLYFGVIVFGAPFIDLWLGPELAAAPPLAAILACSELATVFTSTATLTLFSLGRLRVQFTIAVLHALSIVLLSVLLTGPLGFGLTGLAVGVLLPSIAFAGFAYPRAAARAIDLPLRPFYLRASARLLLVAALALAVFAGAARVVGVESWPRLLTAIAASTLVYLLLAAPVTLGLDGLRRAIDALPLARSRRQPAAGDGR